MFRPKTFNYLIAINGNQFCNNGLGTFHLAMQRFGNAETTIRMNNCLIKLASIVCTIHIVVQQCECLNLIDLPYQPGQAKWKKSDHKSNTELLEDHKHVPGPTKFEEYKSENLPPKPIRKYWLLNENENSHYSKAPVHLRVYEDEKDANLKQKIANLVDQTMKDTQKKMKQTEEIQAEHRDESPYKVGFILCMIKKSKNVMDELFNVAVKHKDQWKSLQHLKVFELIAHTNVDSTNLLRQLVDVRLKHINASKDKKNR